MLTQARAFRSVATLLGVDQQKRLSLLNSLAEEQWLAIIAEANNSFLGPTLYAEATRRQWIHLVPDDVRNYLAELHRLNVARNECIREQLLECLECFNANMIVPLLLKGAASLPDAQDLGARIIRDIDLLVREEDRERALQALTGLGYRIWTLEPAGKHAVGAFARPGDPAALDIHHEIIAESHLVPAASFWRACGRVDFGRAQAFVPTRAHRLLHIVMHEMVHNDAYICGSVSLRALHDFNCLMPEVPDNEWPAIDRHLTESRAISPFAAMAYANERLLGSRQPPIPIRGLAPRMFYARSALRRYGLLPRSINQLWMYAHKVLAGHYFDPARHAPPLALWRIRRVMYFARRAIARFWVTGSMTAW